MTNNYNQFQKNQNMLIKASIFKQQLINPFLSLCLSLLIFVFIIPNAQSQQEKVTLLTTDLMSEIEKGALDT